MAQRRCSTIGISYLGHALLLRSNRGIRLSTEGEALLPYAERILSLTDQLSLKPASQGKLHCSIGLVEDLVSNHFTRVLGKVPGQDRECFLSRT